MIERGKRTKLNLYDDAMNCPNCGGALIYNDGVQKCQLCEYQLEINEIVYNQQNSHLCIICGNTLLSQELQICEQCKIKIKKNLEEII